MSDETRCVFEVDPKHSDTVVCVRGGCGRRMWVIPGQPLERYTAPCNGGRPGIVSRAKNYAKAMRRDLSAKRPRRTPDEALAIVAICESNQCGLYNAAKGWCEHTKCGCGVKKKAAYFLERCPVGLW